MAERLKIAGAGFWGLLTSHATPPQRLSAFRCHAKLMSPKPSVQRLCCGYDPFGQTELRKKIAPIDLARPLVRANVLLTNCGAMLVRVYGKRSVDWE